MEKGRNKRVDEIRRLISHIDVTIDKMMKFKSELSKEKFNIENDCDGVDDG